MPATTSLPDAQTDINAHETRLQAEGILGFLDEALACTTCHAVQYEMGTFLPLICE